jgi:hypothetical protein
VPPLLFQALTGVAAAVYAGWRTTPIRTHDRQSPDPQPWLADHSGLRSLIVDGGTERSRSSRCAETGQFRQRNANRKEFSAPGGTAMNPLARYRDYQ